MTMRGLLMPIGRALQLCPEAICVHPRMARYKEVLAQMQQAGLVYPCYMSVAELDALRERQMANKEKPRYDGTWRPEPGKTLPPVPEGVKPVLRFKNPLGGVVAWDDKVKGRIEISNDELDDLVAFLKALTDDRVRKHAAPFDHPQLAVPNGHSGNTGSVANDGTTQLD